MIENEFGEIGIDDALLAKNTKLQADEDLIEMLNGCVCCTVRQDLSKVLQKLAKRCQSGELHLDAIVIETTGMADPSPVAQTFFVDYAVKAFARLDGIVTLVDAKHIEQHLDEEKPKGVDNESVEQVPRVRRATQANAPTLAHRHRSTPPRGCTRVGLPSRHSWRRVATDVPAFAGRGGAAGGVCRPADPQQGRPRAKRSRSPAHRGAAPRNQ